MAAAAEIEYPEEEALLLQGASAFLAEHCDFAAVRRTMATQSGYDPELYRRIAELGWLGVALPAAYGGAELRAGALVSLCEPMGRSLLASPFLATTLAAQALLRAGNPAQRERWLPRFAAGTAVGSIALSEPSASFELEPLQARATRAGSGFALSGQKAFALDAAQADAVLIALELEGTPALVLVEAPLLEGRMRRERLVDETRRSYRIALDGLRVDKDALLDGGDAPAALAHVQRLGWLLVAAEMAGGAEGVLQLTLEYLRTRTQFGKPIGSYQALKHPMVEIMCAIEQGRSLLYHAATAFDRADPERELALRMAKAQLGDTYVQAADRSIQFHGAIGFTYECHAQLFFRRAQWAQYTFGDSMHHRRHLAQML